jgi:hypothetical protein
VNAIDVDREARMNDAMRRLDVLAGTWDVTMTHAWFLDSLDTEIQGSATFVWLADAFLVMRSRWSDDSTWELALGRNDARDESVAFYHDDRGVYRVFDMTFGDGDWTLLRQDPDFHQRLVMRVQSDRIDVAPRPLTTRVRPGARTSTTSSSVAATRATNRMRRS